MYTNNKFAGYPPVHPVARHTGFRQTCEELVAKLPKRTGIRVILNSVVVFWQTWQKRRTDRQAFQHMIALDDNLLRDIGITRADVIWANKLPLSQNAAAELEKIALQNKRG